MVVCKKLCKIRTRILFSDVLIKRKELKLHCSKICSYCEYPTSPRKNYNCLHDFRTENSYQIYFKCGILHFFNFITYNLKYNNIWPVKDIH